MLKFKKKHILEQFWKLNNSEQLIVPTLATEDFTLEDLKEEWIGFTDKEYINKLHQIDIQKKTIGNWWFKPLPKLCKILPPASKPKSSNGLNPELKEIIK